MGPPEPHDSAYTPGIMSQAGANRPKAVEKTTYPNGRVSDKEPRLMSHIWSRMGQERAAACG